MAVTMEFRKVLFDDGDYVCVGKNAYATDIMPCVALDETKLEFFSINSLKDKRADKNVTKYRNFLFEMDDLPPKQQVKLVTETDMPWSTAVFSGNKSIHWIISLEEPVKNKEEYKMWWNAIYDCAVRHHIVFDKATSNPSRFSRIPNVIRQDKNKKQTLVKVNKRINNDELLNWLYKYGVDPENYRPQKYKPVDEDSNASEDEKFEFVKKCMKGKNYTQGNRDNYQYEIAILCKRVGLDESQARMKIYTECGELHEDGRAVRSAYSSDVTPINVVPYEEYKRQQRRQDSMDLGFEAPEVNELPELNRDDFDALSNHVIVGNHVYCRMPDNTYQKRTTERFCIAHRRTDLPMLPKFIDFVNEPDYLKPRDVVGNYVNLFRSTGHNIKPGKWKNIEVLLKHIFNEQYQIGLDYLQIQYFINPKQLSYILCLVSNENETGKTTFLEFMNAMFNNNGAIISTSDFEEDWNAHFCSKHFIMVDESKFENPKKVANKLKQWATQKTITIREKNVPNVTVNFFGKIILATNDEDNFVHMDDEDNRYWVRRVPPFPKQHYRQGFLKDCIKEIPHFLNFLQSRSLHVQKPSGRFWHSQDQIATEYIDNVKRSSKSDLFLELEAIFEKIFEERPELHDINCKPTDLRDRLPEKIQYKYKLKDVTECLKGEFKSNKKKKLAVDTLNDNRKVVNNFYTIERSHIMSDVFSTQDYY
jgi:hypothetical protein